MREKAVGRVGGPGNRPAQPNDTTGCSFAGELVWAPLEPSPPYMSSTFSAVPLLLSQVLPPSTTPRLSPATCTEPSRSATLSLSPLALYSLLPIAISASQLSPSLHSLLQSTSSSTSTRAHRLSHSNPIIIELSLSQERPSPASIISFSSLLPTPVACGESRCALSFSWSPAFINNRLITSRGGSTLPSSSNRLTFQR